MSISTTCLHACLIMDSEHLVHSSVHSNGQDQTARILAVGSPVSGSRIMWKFVDKSYNVQGSPGFSDHLLAGSCGLPRGTLPIRTLLGLSFALERRSPCGKVYKRPNGASCHPLGNCVIKVSHIGPSAAFQILIPLPKQESALESMRYM